MLLPKAMKAVNGVNPQPKRKAFTLIEIIVVIVVIGALSSLMLAAISRMGAEARTVECMNNLRQISQAVEAYYSDRLCFPGRNLRSTLKGYLKDESVFICPEDLKHENDSYSKFYIVRNDDDVNKVRICCPRHNSSNASSILFGGSRTVKRSSAFIKYNANILIEPGDTVEGGVLEFEDGSTVNISSGTQIQVITSFRKSNSKLYSIIRVGLGQEGNIDVQVTPGSQFEVVTPSAIAGVRGTKFKMFFRSDDAYNFSLLEVTEGSVEMRPKKSRKCLVIESPVDASFGSMGRGNNSGLLESILRRLRKAGDYGNDQLISSLRMLPGKYYKSVGCSLVITAGQQMAAPKQVTVGMKDNAKYRREMDEKKRDSRYHRFYRTN